MKTAEIKESTRKVIRGFPKLVRADLGVELMRVQDGLDPTDWKPMPSVGKGVREIRVSYRGQWRMIYVATLGDAVYVLHAFQKKTQRTAKADIEIAKQRFKEVTQRAK